MPWMLPLGVRPLVLKSACASSHRMRSFLPPSRQWRATALIEPMPRQWSPPSRIGKRPALQFGVHGVVHRVWFHATTSVEVPVAVDRRPATDSAGRCRLPRSSTSRPWPSSIGPMLATRSASGPMLAPRAPAPMSVGAPIRLINFGSWRILPGHAGRRHSRSGVGRDPCRLSRQIFDSFEAVGTLRARSQPSSAVSTKLEQVHVERARSCRSRPAGRSRSGSWSRSRRRTAAPDAARDLPVWISVSASNSSSSVPKPPGKHASATERIRKCILRIAK